MGPLRPLRPADLHEPARCRGRSACAARPAASRPGTPWRRCGRSSRHRSAGRGRLGAAVGYFGAQFGWFMIVVGFFAGTLIAEALDRTVGIKRGPRILAIAVAGILVGGSSAAPSRRRPVARDAGVRRLAGSGGHAGLSARRFPHAIRPVGPDRARCDDRRSVDAGSGGSDPASSAPRDLQSGC